MTQVQAGPRKRRVGFRYVLTYVLALIFGVVALAIAVSLEDGVTAAPQAPAMNNVAGPMSECLGARVAVVQSGVFLDLLQVDATTNKAGDHITSARLDGEAGTGEVSGTCPDGTPRAGEEFQLDLTVANASITGSGTLGGQPTTLSTVATEASAAAPTPATTLTGSLLSGRIYLAVAIVILAARGIGALFARIRQPRVVGEIVAGIVLGPSVVGQFFPEVTAYLFPPEVTSILKMLANVGLIFFMFLIGLELDHKLLRGSGRTALIVSHVSIIVPFGLGLLLALSLYPLLGSGNVLGFILFMGAAMAITAFPVLARILTDTGIHRTRLGALAITCAAVDDVTAWCMLAVVVAVVKSAGPTGALPTIVQALVFVLAMLFLVRPLLARLAAVHESRGRLNPPVMAGIFIAILVASWTTEEIGIHAIFGAFLLGAVMPRSRGLREEITGKVEDFTVLLLLPIFFAVVGLSTRFDLLGNGELWLIAGVVLLVAVVGKWGGGMIAARVAGEGWRHSAGLGILMNARGLTEIVILTIGRDLGVISPALFTIMVMMALVTSFMATPLLAFVYPRRMIDWELYRESAAAREVKREGAHRVLVALGGSDHDERLLTIAAGMRGPDGRHPELVLVQVVPPPGREEIRAQFASLDEAVEDAVARLEAPRASLAARGFRVTVRAAAGLDIGAEIARLAGEEAADLVLLGWHRAYLGRNLLKGVPGKLLVSGLKDVAVLVDDENRVTPTTGPVAIWYNGPVTGGAALDAAVSLARGMGTSLLVAHDAHVEQVDLSATGVTVEWLQIPELDIEALQPALSSARLVVIGEFQRSTLGTSRREHLVGSVTCPVLVVQGARVPTEPEVGSTPALGTPVQVPTTS